MDNIVFLMTKTPIQGIIKTRLAKSLGNCSVKRFTLQNIENVKKNLINIKNLNFFLYTTPKKKFRSFSFNFFKNTILQKGFNIGEKIWYLRSVVNKSFIVIGSDIPDIKVQNLSYAFKLLKKSDIVIGPSFDSGFWLIGFSKRKAINYPFKDIRWGTKHVLSDLEKNTKKYNLKISFCERLRDIDIIDDYCDYINKV